MIRACSRATATVDFPEPESPVSQRVHPAWPSTFVRSAGVIWLSCQVMLSDLGFGIGFSSIDHNLYRVL